LLAAIVLPPVIAVLSFTAILEAGGRLCHVTTLLQNSRDITPMNALRGRRWRFMELDMYLSKCIFLSGEAQEALEHADKVSYVIEDIGYWQKANAIDR
jgi:hypothetical protein